MAGSAPFKSQAMARDLKMRLDLTVGGITCEQSQDANGYPVLKMTKGSEIQFAKVEPVGGSGRVDGLGLAQTDFSPHKITLLRDSDTISDMSFREHLVAEAAKSGAKVLLYDIAALPSSYDLTGATLVASLPSDPINPLTAQQ